MKKRTIYVVITPGRIFTFGSHPYAYRFYRRAQKLPSMQGQTVELVCTSLTTGRRQFDTGLKRELERQEKINRNLWAPLVETDYPPF